jgi:hypothetical protein
VRRYLPPFAQSYLSPRGGDPLRCNANDQAFAGGIDN